jgi:hypothetical protein
MAQRGDITGGTPVTLCFTGQGSQAGLPVLLCFAGLRSRPGLPVRRWVARMVAMGEDKAGTALLRWLLIVLVTFGSGALGAMAEEVVR